MKIGDKYEVTQAYKDANVFICGCEYEIEDIKGYGGIDKHLYIDEDHSLRNNGKEFKSSPQTFESTVEQFKFLHQCLKLGPKPFTDRTSIHVHVNVTNLTLSQARQFVLCYALFEPLFFNYVGEIRKNSIFCVPLSYTYVPETYRLEFPKMVTNWHKYTALNILCVQQFGTIEFRHMYGTADVDKFKFWLQSIKDLWDFIYESPDFSLIKTLENDDNLRNLADLIVPTISMHWTEVPLRTLCKDSLLDVKLSSGIFVK